MFYGARYYSPFLGRFITPDSVVQSPGNPQTLNRYSYCNNNPVNLIDPTGHSWKNFWKGVTKALSWVVGGVLLHDQVYQAFQGNWQPLGNVFIAVGSAFVFSGFNPIAAVAAAGTTAFLDSRPGQQLTKLVASEIFDDAFGMRPGSAYVWSRITLQVAGSLTVENVLKGAMGNSVASSKYDLKNPSQNSMIENPKGYEPSGGRIPGGENAPRYPGGGFDLTKTDLNKMVALTVKGQSTPTAILGVGRFGPDMLHTGAISSTFSGSGIERLAFGNNFFNGYATVFGVCHQAANATLLASGISSTVWDVAPHWSTFASTIAYGNYGGQLSNYVYTGVRTDRGYDK